MLNFEEIEQYIDELENSPTTLNNCQKLSVLYICREFAQKDDANSETANNDEVIEQYSDILPEYKEYCKIKKDYAFNKVTENAVIKEINDVCNEIFEFINTLYSSTDMPEERKIILQMIKKLNRIGN